MYTISRVLEGIILTCSNCDHIEHVSQFDLHIGSQRTHAAGAMQAHSRAMHNGVLLKPLPKNYGVMERW